MFWRSAEVDNLLALAVAVVDDSMFKADIAPLSASAWQKRVETMDEVISHQSHALDLGFISRERFLETVVSPFLSLSLKTNQMSQQATSLPPRTLVKLQQHRLDSMLTIWGKALRFSFDGTGFPDPNLGIRYIPSMAAEKRAGLIKRVLDGGVFQVYTCTSCYQCVSASRMLAVLA